MKRNLLLALVSLAVLGILFSIASYGYRLRIEGGSPREIAREAQFITEIDTDGDGLKDWEEELWNTDSQNKDSDGDGTGDGEEILFGRNPSIPGPNDKIKISSISLEDLENTASTTNRTDLVSREIFAHMIDLYRSGNFNSETIESAGDDIVKKIDEIIPEDRYVITDLTITSDNSPLSYRAFGNKMGFATKKFDALGLPSETILIEEIAETQDTSRLVEFAPYPEAYKELTRDFLSIPVPSQIASAYLLIVNGNANVADALELLTNAGDDPTGGVLGVNLYAKGASKSIEAINFISLILKGEGIFFETNEPGSLIFK